MKRLYLILLITAISLVSSSQQSSNDPTKFPALSWEKVKNISVAGWDSLKLAEIKKFILDSTNATGFVVIYNGEILFEYGDITELSSIASGRKSVLAMLYGPFVKIGKIDLSKTLAELKFDDKDGLSTVEKQARIEHLMTARSGVYHIASNPENLPKKPARYSVKPGEIFYYNNWDFNAAGFIFEKLTGIDIYEAVDSMLAKPLQMQDWRKTLQIKSGDTSKSHYLSYSMSFSTRDMARLGYLMLRKGKWKNLDVISADWIKKITSVVTPYNETVAYRTDPPPLAYGYMWWVWENNGGMFDGAYTTWGGGGQYFTVLPKLDLVVAMKTKSVYERQTSMKTYLRLLELLVNAKK